MSAAAWLAVALLGGLAAIARFLLDAAVSERAGGAFPSGTLAVNLSGALLLGILSGLSLDGPALAILAGGGLGSYTTFSTWMLETQRLGEDGRPGLLWLNLAAPLAAGLAVVALGHAIGASLR